MSEVNIVYSHGGRYVEQLFSDSVYCFLALIKVVDLFSRDSNLFELFSTKIHSDLSILQRPLRFESAREICDIVRPDVHNGPKFAVVVHNMVLYNICSLIIGVVLSKMLRRCVQANTRYWCRISLVKQPHCELTLPLLRKCELNDLFKNRQKYGMGMHVFIVLPVAIFLFIASSKFQKMAAQVWKVSLTGISSSSNVLSPAGFSTSRFTDDAQKQVKKKEDDNIINLKQKKAWDMVLDAAKNVPMNMFMMWMSGNSVQIFSIMITVMMFYNSVKGMMSVNSVFEKLAGGRVVLWPQKVVFLLVQCAFLGLGLWKMQGLGLLPTATSDWLSFLPLKEYSEVSAPGVFY